MCHHHSSSYDPAKTRRKLTVPAEQVHAPTLPQLDARCQNQLDAVPTTRASSCFRQPRSHQVEYQTLLTLKPNLQARRRCGHQAKGCISLPRPCPYMSMPAFPVCHSCQQPAVIRSVARLPLQPSDRLLRMHQAQAVYVIAVVLLRPQADWVLYACSADSENLAASLARPRVVSAVEAMCWLVRPAMASWSR